jgi:antitoxin ParD1/3/4
MGEKRIFSAGMLRPYRQIYCYDNPEGRSIPVYRLLVKSGDFLRECFAPTGKFVGVRETGFLYKVVCEKREIYIETRFLIFCREATETEKTGLPVRVDKTWSVMYYRNKARFKNKMSINLTSDQEKLIESKLKSGKYQTPEQVVSTALRLLDEWERAEAEWAEDVGSKIDAAISAAEENPPIDGATFINEILERFKQANEGAP